MKKKLFLLLLIFVGYNTCYSQTDIDQIYSDFSKEKGVEKVTVSKSIIKMVSVFTDVKKVEVLNFNACTQDVKDKFDDVLAKVKDSKFETMISKNENGSRTKILVRIENDKIKELIVLISGSSSVMIRVKGNIKVSNIEDIVNKS